jgi:rSAM/selenodomain-associated transferase 2
MQPRTLPETKVASSAAWLSVIVPALNEEDRIGAAVSSAWEAGADEVIVADGGSRDATAERARASGARVIAARRGRASQMNAGAAAARGDAYLFLHADSILPRDARTRVAEALAAPEVGGGAFRMRIHRAGIWWRVATALAQARAHWWSITLGDQGIFVRREVFEDLGGFRELPILEDLDLVDRLRNRALFRVSRSEVRSSARRWEQRGVLRTSLVNAWILFRYKCGARPEDLASLYH